MKIVILLFAVLATINAAALQNAKAEDEPGNYFHQMSFYVMNLWIFFVGVVVVCFLSLLISCINI